MIVCGAVAGVYAAGGIEVGPGPLTADAVSAAAENNKGDVFILLLIQDDLKVVYVQRERERERFNLKAID